jgi:DNA-directed RNA polymerases I and III subunit RPAC1
VLSFIYIFIPIVIVRGQVPTVCIEHVYVWNNTSVIVDEVFAQRIGLVPLRVDPALIEMKDGKQ